MTRTRCAALTSPEYLGRLSEIERFEAVAVDHGAVFWEIVLMDGRQQSVERFYRSGGDGDLAWRRHLREVVERHGGPALLAGMHDQLTRVLAARPDATVIPSAAGAIRQTYGALVAILDPDP